MPQASTDERIQVRLAADPERMREGARRILESDVQTATESLVETASFDELITWEAILTFCLDNREDGLMGAISKVVYAPDAKRIGAPQLPGGRNGTG